VKILEDLEDIADLGWGRPFLEAFTWFMVPNRIADPAKRKEIAALLRWILTNGQKDCEGLGYAPLPREVVAKELRMIDELRQ
jgi:hypothetical protein